MVFGNVVLRYVFNSGLEFSEEVSRFVFVWLTFIGSVVALREGLHLGMDTVVKRFSRQGKLACYCVSHLLMLWCCVLLFKGSLEQARVNLNNFAPVSKLPIAVVYSVGLFAATFMGGILLHGLWRAVRGRLSDEELVEVKESEDSSAEIGTEK
ncbi:TRAP transporter small permease [Propionivibrio sp.]|uniref:TRAP transporter small permease n=1 Tax=Propionivibrio sp. TaxID=2212460 RepID=UPI0039E69FC3